MESNEVTIRFRAKRDTFSGGVGYKVPKLTTNHVTVKHRDTLGITFLAGLRNEDLTRARLKSFADMRLPGVVFENEPDGWTIRPIGNGFMAEISITRPLIRNPKTN